MPTYTYACTACEHGFDIRQSFADDPLTVCPQCNGRLRKVIHPVGITFKGSGFYKTDSRSGEASSSVGSTKDSGAKDSGAKDSSTKDTGSKDTGASGSSSGTSGSTGSSGTSSAASGSASSTS